MISAYIAAFAFIVVNNTFDLIAWVLPNGWFIFLF
jgi:hypothetical protein